MNALLLAATIATIPFRWTPGQIEIQVSVNGGAPAWFILDSGSEASFLDTEFAKRLRIKSKYVRFTAGPVTLDDIHVTVRPFTNFKQQGRAIEGVLGYEAFERYVVTVDFKQNELTLADPKTYSAPQAATAIPISFAGRLPVVDGRLAFGDAAPIAARLMIDTGAQAPIVLRQPFTAASDLAKYKTESTTSPSFASGTVAMIKLPLRQLSIGPFVFNMLTARAYATNSGAGGYTETDGLIGNEVLRNFRVTFDYSRSRILLEPSGTMGQLDALRKAIAGREDEPAERVFKNVVVLPETLPGVTAARLLLIMEIAYSRSLGVDCTHCHAAGNFADDAKEPKRIARQMSRMTTRINRELLGSIEELTSRRPSVTCATCHRGSVKPARSVE